MDELKEKLVPYDREVADVVFSKLFITDQYSTEGGLSEVPSASYQLVVSALELMLWEVRGETHDTLKRAVGIVQGLRDAQKMREWKRRES